jgi:hypothetical protein
VSVELTQNLSPKNQSSAVSLDNAKDSSMKAASQNPIELWKAIHGGCWPGPPPDLRLTQQVNEVIAGLALYNLASTFGESRVASQARTLAAASLNNSLAGLQKLITTQGALRSGRTARAAASRRRSNISSVTRGLMPA